MNINALINGTGAYTPVSPRHAEAVSPKYGQSGGTTQTGQGTGTAEDRVQRPDSDSVRMQNMSDELSTLARQNRDVTESLAQIQDYIDGMKAQLEQIVKTYPPYPAGSEERVRALRSYVGFRHLIDRLTIPPQLTAEMSVVTGDTANSAPGIRGGNTGTGN